MAEDQIEVLDKCAEAVGLNRSNFLSLILDGFYEEIISFARGYAVQLFHEKEEEEEP